MAYKLIIGLPDSNKISTKVETFLVSFNSYIPRAWNSLAPTILVKWINEWLLIMQRKGGSNKVLLDWTTYLAELKLWKRYAFSYGNAWVRTYCCPVPPITSDLQTCSWWQGVVMLMHQYWYIRSLFNNQIIEGWRWGTDL